MSSYLGFAPSEEKNAYFVSYNTEDGPSIRPILCKLNEMGVPLWYDHGLEYGKRWAEQIAAHIDNSQAVILFFSKGILQKENSYVQKEYKMAKEFYDKQVFVVLLDRITKQDVPYDKVAWWIDIQAEQNIDAIGAPSDDAFCRKLAVAIGAKVPEEQPAEAEKPIPPKAEEASAATVPPVVETEKPVPPVETTPVAEAEKAAASPVVEETPVTTSPEAVQTPAPVPEPPKPNHTPAQESWKLALEKQRQLEAQREKTLQQQKQEVPQQKEDSQVFQVVRGVGSLMRGIMQQMVKPEPEKPAEEPEMPAPQVSPEESWKLAQVKQRQLEAQREKDKAWLAENRRNSQEQARREAEQKARQDPNYIRTPAQENWKQVLQRQQTDKK